MTLKDKIGCFKCSLKRRNNNHFQIWQELMRIGCSCCALFPTSWREPRVKIIRVPSRIDLWHLLFPLFALNGLIILRLASPQQNHSIICNWHLFLIEFLLFDRLLFIDCQYSILLIKWGVCIIRIFCIYLILIVLFNLWCVYIHECVINF